MSLSFPEKPYELASFELAEQPCSSKDLVCNFSVHKLFVKSFQNCWLFLVNCNLTRVDRWNGTKSFSEKYLETKQVLWFFILTGFSRKLIERCNLMNPEKLKTLSG